MIRLEFDGLFRSMDETSPAGIMCYGWRILRKKAVVAHGHGTFASASQANANIAEYLALIEGLEALSDMRLKSERGLVCGDSKSVIQQMQGRAGISAPAIKPLHQKARDLAAGFRRLTWVWLPRKFNRGADALSRLALKYIYYDPREYGALLHKVNAARARLSTELIDINGLRIYLPGPPSIQGIIPGTGA